jgi:hypothetical protein
LPRLNFEKKGGKMFFKKLFGFRKEKRDNGSKEALSARLKELERDYSNAEKNDDFHAADKCRRQIAECKVNGGFMD